LRIFFLQTVPFRHYCHGGKLRRLAEPHKAVGVAPEDYTLFLDCVKETIWRFDKDYWPDKAEGWWWAAA